MLHKKNLQLSSLFFLITVLGGVAFMSFFASPFVLRHQRAVPKEDKTEQAPKNEVILHTEDQLLADLHATKVVTHDSNDNPYIVAQSSIRSVEVADTSPLNTVLVLKKRTEGWEVLGLHSLLGPFNQVGTYSVSPQKDTILFTVTNIATGCSGPTSCQQFQQDMAISQKHTGVWKFDTKNYTFSKVKSVVRPEADTTYTITWLSDHRAEIKYTVPQEGPNPDQEVMSDEVTFVVSI